MVKITSEGRVVTPEEAKELLPKGGVTVCRDPNVFVGSQRVSLLDRLYDLRTHDDLVERARALVASSRRFESE
jgi:hypothetical protein